MHPITVFGDYRCPYVYRASEWLCSLERLLDPAPKVEWRFFSLAQVNHRIKDGWEVWAQPEVNPEWEKEDFAPGLRNFWAAAAAQRQGDEAFRAFHGALLRAIHADKREIESFATLREIAQAAGLDHAAFMCDVGDVACLARLAEDHRAGVEKKVFGTPTFVLGDATPAYLKLSRTLDDREAVEMWDSFATVVAERPYVLEIKRPQ